VPQLGRALADLVLYLQPQWGPLGWLLAPFASGLLQGFDRHLDPDGVSEPCPGEFLHSFGLGRRKETCRVGGLVRIIMMGFMRPFVLPSSSIPL
jgi:hypothetical protein